MNIRPRLSHSNSFGNDAEKDTAGCRAFNRKYIVIEDEKAAEMKMLYLNCPPEMRETLLHHTRGVAEELRDLSKKLEKE